ncbi:MAG: hypothetical protein ABWX84_01580, partial [Nocardioides sp.]
MDVSGAARRVMLGLVTASLVAALAGLGWAPAATAAPPYDEAGLMKAGSFAEFDVLENDDAGPEWYAEPVDSSDPSVSGGFGPSLFVDLSETPSFTGTKAIAYNVYDDSFELVRTATLTVTVVTAALVAEGGNAQVTLRWPGLPAAVNGVRISYGTGGVFDHTPEAGKTTVIRSGAAPWTITGLTNGTEYDFYVTPRIGASELSEGETASRAPRAGTNAPPVAVDDTFSLIDDQERFLDPTENDTDADDDSLQMV